MLPNQPDEIKCKKHVDKEISTGVVSAMFINNKIRKSKKPSVYLIFSDCIFSPHSFTANTLATTFSRIEG